MSSGAGDRGEQREQQQAPAVPAGHQQQHTENENAEMKINDPLAQTDRHPAFDESANNLTDMLRGLVSRWETLDFTVSANSFALDDRMQAWQAAQAAQGVAGARAELPGAYERR